MYELELLNKYKKEYQFFLSTKTKFNVSEKKLILTYFERQITVDNIKVVYSLPKIIFHSLLLKGYKFNVPKFTGAILKQTVLSAQISA